MGTPLVWKEWWRQINNVVKLIENTCEGTNRRTKKKRHKYWHPIT